MLSGPIAGRLLEMLVWFGRPRRVLEIGTFSGHSALTMAGALPDDGHIDTCEISPEARRGRAALLRLQPVRRTASRSTSGRRSRRSTASRAKLDFVFIDANKDGYVDYYEAVLPRLARRGLIAVDNTLYQRPRARRRHPRSSQFNEHVRSDPRAVRVILSVRDGITLIRRR